MKTQDRLTVCLLPHERKAVELETKRRGMRTMSDLVRTILYKDIPSMVGGERNG